MNSAPPALTTATRGRRRSIVSATPSYQTVSPGEVELVEDEAADRAEQLGDRSRAVASRRADDADAVPEPLVHDRLGVETELAERILVLGLAEDREFMRDQLGAATVEMVAVAVRDDDGIEIAHDVLRGHRQRYQGVRCGLRVFSIGGREPASSRAGSTSSRLPASLDEHRRVADEREPHGCSSTALPLSECPFRLQRYTDRPFSHGQRNDYHRSRYRRPGVWTTGPDGELIPDYDATFPEINEGEVVHGTVVRVDKDEVLVDIGYKSEGVIPVAELSIRRSINPDDEVGVGDEIDALVLTKEDAEGWPILSKKRPVRARLEGDRAQGRERRADHGTRDRGREGAG